jgi:hypothetical protein
MAFQKHYALYPKGISFGAYIELFDLAIWSFELTFYEFVTITSQTKKSGTHQQRYE